MEEKEKKTHGHLFLNICNQINPVLRQVGHGRCTYKQVPDNPAINSIFR